MKIKRYLKIGKKHLITILNYEYLKNILKFFFE